MPAKPLRVILAEDSALTRDGVSEILRRFGHEVVDAVGDAEALIDAVDRCAPDVVVTDVRMPPGHSDEGLRAALRLRAKSGRPAIVVLSHYVEPALAAELLESTGEAVGYLLKDRISDVGDFVATVERVADGDCVIDPEVVRRLLRRTRSREPIDRLSTRERQVLALLAEGRSNSAIARILVVSDAAVEKHIRAVFTKLELPPRPDDHRRVLAVVAYLRGSRATGT